MTANLLDGIVSGKTEIGGWEPSVKVALCILCDDCETDLLSVDGRDDCFPACDVVDLIRYAKRAHARVCEKRVAVTLENADTTRNPDEAESLVDACQGRVDDPGLLCVLKPKHEGDCRAWWEMRLDPDDRNRPKLKLEDLGACERWDGCDLEAGHPGPCQNRGMSKPCERSVACDLPLGHEGPCLPWCGVNGCVLKPKHGGICLDVKGRAVSHIHGCGLMPLHEGPCETRSDG